MKISKRQFVIGVEAIISAGAIMFLNNIRVTNVFSLFLLVSIYMFYDKYVIECKDKIIFKVALGVASVLTAFITVLGMQVVNSYSFSNVQSTIATAVILVGIFLLVYRILILLYQWGKQKSLIVGCSETKECNVRKKFWLTFCIILLCWLPFYLMNYPGVVISDSCDQMGQAVNGVYSNHHPVVQTWIIQFVFWICGHFTDNFNTYVAVYCCLQAIVVALIYAYMVKSLYEYGVKEWYCIIVIAYYALMPYNIMFGINMWKDTLFSAFMLLFIVILWKNMNTRGELKLSKNIFQMILLFISGFGVCMFRNNGLYSFILVSPVIFIALWKQKKSICITIVSIMLAVIVVRGPVFKIVHVSQPDMIESLSIPAQQIAKVITENGRITEEQKQQLNMIVDVNQIPLVYDVRGSDPVKNLVRQTGNQKYLVTHKKEYLKLWIEIGLKNPGYYLQAYVQQTEGYWNPDIQRWQYTQGICETQIPIETTPLLPQFMCKILNKYVENWGWSIPIIGMLWSIGAMVWLTIILAGLCLIRKKIKDFLLFIPPIALWMTVMIATPVYAEFRYIYAIFLCIPLYLVVAFSARNMQPEIREIK